MKVIQFALSFIIFLTFSNFIQTQDDNTITMSSQDDDQNKGNVVVPKEEKAEINKEDLSNEELDKDGYEINKNDKYVINITDYMSFHTQDRLPEAQVILPIRRVDTSKSLLNVSPCGGVPKKKSHTLTNKGKSLYVIWEITNPIAQGNCTVKISPGLEKEENFTVLVPVDIPSNSKGVFPCGRVKSFESHEFKLPQDYVCDQCTVQWTWITPVGNIYSCSDIIINGNKINDCLAMCKNGGACFNGKCLCTNDFYGDLCENTYYNNSGGYGWIVLVIILMLIIGGAVYYFLTNKSSPTWLKPRSGERMESHFNERNNKKPIELS